MNGVLNIRPRLRIALAPRGSNCECEEKSRDQDAFHSFLHY
jgi:hypothetical protein